MELNNMEYVIVILLLVLIFKDELIDLIRSFKKEPEREKSIEEKQREKEKEQRKEEFEQELNKIMDYNIDTAIDSKSKKRWDK